MAEVITRSREADGVEFPTSEAKLAASFGHPVDFDPVSDVLVADVRGSIVGVARVWRDERADGALAFGQYVDLVPEWRRGRLREVLFEYNERHARGLAVRDTKERRHVLVLWANSDENEWKSLAVRHGYQEAQHEIDMVRSLGDVPDLPLPAGIEVRPVTPDDVRKVWDANREAWRETWGYSESRWDDAHFEAALHSPEFQPNLWQIAWDGDTLVGMVLPYILPEENERYGCRRGHAENVYVLEGYRGRGIARALLARALRVLKERGMDEATLGTEVENPHRALRIYESMGFRIVKHFTWYEKSL